MARSRSLDFSAPLQLLLALAEHVHVQLRRAYCERENDVGVEDVDAGPLRETRHTRQTNRLWKPSQGAHACEG